MVRHLALVLILFIGFRALGDQIADIIMSLDAQAPPAPSLGADPDPNYRSPVPDEEFRAAAEGHCAKYIRDDGTYGPKGLAIRREILGLGQSENKVDYFLHTQLPRMERLCPNFYSLGLEERVNFWVWYMMAVAHDESKCGHPDWLVRSNATHGVAAGDFQLNEAYRGHRDWRGEGCDAKHAKLNGYIMVNPDNNIPCAIQILGDALCGFYSSNRGVCTGPKAPFGSHLYWSRLKANSGPTIAQIKEFPLCQ